MQTQHPATDLGTLSKDSFHAGEIFEPSVWQYSWDDRFDAHTTIEDDELDFDLDTSDLFDDSLTGSSEDDSEARYFDDEDLFVSLDEDEDYDYPRGVYDDDFERDEGSHINLGEVDSAQYFDADELWADEWLSPKTAKAEAFRVEQIQTASKRMLHSSTSRWVGIMPTRTSDNDSDSRSRPLTEGADSVEGDLGEGSEEDRPARSLESEFKKWRSAYVESGFVLGPPPKRRLSSSSSGTDGAESYRSSGGSR